MRFWAPILCLGTALASTIPIANSHELHLPFSPSPDSLENGVHSSLSINWSIQNGSLYANQDKVYPPSVTMQLRAPLYQDAQLTDNSVDLSYTLDSRPLSTDQVGAVAGIVRVRVELLDLHGNLVSPDAVVIDLLTYQDGNHHITRIRVEPARGDGRSQKNRPWVVKYWKTQFGSFFESEEQSTQRPAESPATKVTTANHAVESESKFAISSFWAAPPHANYRGHRRPHHHRPGNSFVRMVRPIILPAVLGAVAGLVACLVGFFIGHLIMSFAVRLGWKGPVQQRTARAEQGTASEKSPMVPHVYVTDATESV